MNKTYAFTDLHGMYSLWEQIRDFCDESDTLFFLGDACDRGDAGIRIITELLRDKRVKYLKGNHEDMLTIVGPELAEGHYENYNWWLLNGGYQTAQDFLEMEPLSQEWLVKKLNALPDHMWYTNKDGKEIFLSHAGTDLNYSKRDLQLMGRKDPYIWDRKHIGPEWPQEEEYANKYVVHGHTPVQLLRGSDVMDAAYYAHGHKIDLDFGSFDSCMAALFDLDEMKVVKVFLDEESFKTTCT